MNEINPRAVWKGRPTQTVIDEIKSCTISDEQGRLYYRLGWPNGWRRLRTALDYTHLNVWIERYRKAKD